VRAAICVEFGNLTGSMVFLDDGKTGGRRGSRRAGGARDALVFRQIQSGLRLEMPQNQGIRGYLAELYRIGGRMSSSRGWSETSNYGWTGHGFRISPHWMEVSVSEVVNLFTGEIGMQKGIELRALRDARLWADSGEQDLPPGEVKRRSRILAQA
jgi:hypothetical protein